MFRQQAASSPGLDWSQLNSSLFAVTFLAQQNGRGKTCRFCLRPTTWMRSVHLPLWPLKLGRCHQHRARVHQLDRTLT